MRPRQPACSHRQRARADLRPVRITTPPKLDGILDDEAWSGDPLPLDGWIVVQPDAGRGGGGKDPGLDRATTTRRCTSRSVASIRSPTKFGRRSAAATTRSLTIGSGVSLDSSRAGQLAYHLFVNPSGIQMDALQSGIDRRRFCARLGMAKRRARRRRWLVRGDPRAAREHPLSERRRRAHGRAVLAAPEPHRRLGIVARNGRRQMGVRVQCGDRVRRASVSAPARDDSELRPSRVTRRVRIASRWNATRARGDFGVSVKYGLTSAVTLDATVNPDFSQVESDAFEVEVNQRFPIFFSEKRPFFMEGLGLFNHRRHGRRFDDANGGAHEEDRRSERRPEADWRSRADIRLACCRRPTRLPTASGSACLPSHAK